MAKKIQEKYEFKLTGEQELKRAFGELGIKLHIDSSNKNSCVIVTMLEHEINVYIRYHTEKFRYYTREMSDKIFCYFYALSILILYCDKLKVYEKIEFNYGKNIDEEIDEKIAIKVALFMLYIKYDYDYRKKEYSHKLCKSGELPNIHPCFYNKYELDYLCESITTEKVSKILSIKYDDAESIRYKEHLRDKLNKDILEDMLNNIKILEINFGEEYKEISKMTVPMTTPVIVSDRDYNKFGKTRKILF